MLTDLDYDDTGSPAIALVPPDTTWDEIKDHIKISHAPLLILDQGEYTGAYWTGTEMVLVPDLGPDQDEAVEEFRTFLYENDQT